MGVLEGSGAGSCDPSVVRRRGHKAVYSFIQSRFFWGSGTQMMNRRKDPIAIRSRASVDGYLHDTVPFSATVGSQACSARTRLGPRLLAEHHTENRCAVAGFDFCTISYQNQVLHEDQMACAEVR